jgi:hypothetical protein
MISRTALRVMCLLELGLVSASPGVPTGVSFSQSAGSIEAYDFVEITVHVALRSRT